MVKDKELAAIGAIIELLKPLDAIERSRVLEYVLKRLEMGTVQEASLPSGETVAFGERPTETRRITDIRTLTAEKQPRSANEMVALIAYYLSELAPEGSDTVNVDIVRKYFKMAGFPMPRVPKNALTNATAAGYLENVSRGEYKLNPVGYNLVVHALPRSSGNVPSGSVRRKVRVARRKPGRN